MRRADVGADARWLLVADAMIQRLARERDFFTSDDVWKALADSPAATRDNRALGPRMLYAARQGLIKKAGFVLSVRESRHQAPLQVWQSLLRAGGKVVPEADQWRRVLTTLERAGDRESAAFVRARCSIS
ncbi:MAG: hypothetical protein IT371_30435 [Deltaproteobacteria bacterium]|nr:hypothetical protein [Deltaproteobacteria bacterium]